MTGNYTKLSTLIKSIFLVAMLKIGINGFGWIGRLVTRIAMDDAEIEIVSINDLIPSPHLPGIELNSNFFKIVSWCDNQWGYS